MAYHLQSLVTVIELILSHKEQQHNKYFDNIITTPQIKSLLEKACFLRDSFDNHPILSDDSASSSLEDQIRHAAQIAEDVLETSYVALFGTDQDVIPTPDLHELIESFDSAKEEMMKLLDGDQISVDRASPSTVLNRNINNTTDVVVGFKDDLSQLMDRIFGDSSKLEIIPIVGMGGIGKTTLARKIYDDSSVVSHFDARAWATVSDDYSLRDILLGLLGCKRHERINVEDNNLGLNLYQNLKGKRYIIVLDDIWRSNAWDDLKKYFPIDNYGSRIILTTRQSDVATYVDSKTLHHQVRPLGEDDSWELLRKVVFGKDHACPPELEQLGRKIATICGGLPLAIQVIGGILSQYTGRMKNTWEEVAANVFSVVATEDDRVSSILSLSYKNLPYYLKPCFLYMSAFPEDYDIKASKLIRCWVAEGFLKPIQGKSQEEVAEEHLNALINRNLIYVRKRKNIGGVKTLGIHDLLRDLCVLKAREKKFFHVINGRADHNNISPDILCLRRVSILTRSCISDIYGSTSQKPLARSLLYLLHRDLEMLASDFSAMQLLRVLELRDSQFPKALHQVVNLRYLSFNCVNKLHSSITNLRNLQILIIRAHEELTNVPEELFELPHLREIKSNTVMQCGFKESKSFVLQTNMHSVSILEISAGLYLFLAKRPNLKKLAVKYRGGSHPTVLDISCLQKLEKLIFHGNPLREGVDFLLNSSLPVTLKSVTLCFLTVSEACMTALGMLPNLEILRLVSIFFQWLELEPTNDWKQSEVKFCRLKCLRLHWMDMINWDGDETQFPILEHLEILCCPWVEELPSGIGDIPTLKKIEVVMSSRAAGAWAKQIQEEQLDYGNDLLQVIVEV